MGHEVVELSSADQVKKAAWDLLERHRRDSLAQLEDDLHKVEKRQEQADDDLVHE